MLRFVLCLECERSAYGYWPVKVVCPGLLWGLGQGQRSAAGSLDPWDSGGLTGVTRSGQDRTEGIWAQDCGIRAGPLLFPLLCSSHCPCVIAFNLEQTWLQNRSYIEISDIMEYRANGSGLCDFQNRNKLKAFTFPLFFGVITADTFKVETVTNNLSISILTY